MMGSSSTTTTATSTSTSSSTSSLECNTRVAAEFGALCLELNMDSRTSKAAFDAYESIKPNYTLEGSQLHWLACSLYVACMESKVVEGNGVSLSRLLRSFHLSLYEFLKKVTNWCDMCSIPTSIRDRIRHLETSFRVASSIFKEYTAIFSQAFKEPSKLNNNNSTKSRPSRGHSSRQASALCSAQEVFDFCWCLFLLAKETSRPSVAEDLVDSFHLLLACVDFVHANAVEAKREDLLNNDNNGSSDCILTRLCQKGLVDKSLLVKLKAIREHLWRPHMRKLFNEKVLHGESDSLRGILDASCFDLNIKSVRKQYESCVLRIDKYDERVFLGEEASEEIGSPVKTGTLIRSIILSENKHDDNSHKKTKHKTEGMPSTPLSGKHYLKSQDATDLVTRLNDLLRVRSVEPSDKLVGIFKDEKVFDVDPSEHVQRRMETMSSAFIKSSTLPTANAESTTTDKKLMELILSKGKMLCFKVIENTLVSELKLGKQVSGLFPSDQDIFQKALFCCCLEIVLFSHSIRDRVFPWILSVFDLEPIHFYKVIEIIIKHEDALTRDVVMHLKRIEEQVLERMAWTHDSPLWGALERDERGVPTCEEVSLPGTSPSDPPMDNLVPGQSPLSHHRRPFSVLKSPMAGARFKSPLAACARRQLAFGESSNTSSGNTHINPTSPIKGGHLQATASLVFSPQKITSLIHPPAQYRGASAQESGSSGGNSTKRGTENSNSSGSLPPKRTGSLALFFRKVYHIAHLRLNHLCHFLPHTIQRVLEREKKRAICVDMEVKRQAWTTFEYALTKHIDLMRDRHLDQILMCSLYITCKAVDAEEKEKNGWKEEEYEKFNFNWLMKTYKMQPQADPKVFKEVLVHRDGEDGIGSLIEFYNNVYVSRFEEYFKERKHNASSGHVAPLSPMPKLHSATPQSPCRRVSEHHSVFTRPLRSDPDEQVAFTPQSPHSKPFSYSFSRSPAKDLDRINAVMRMEQRKGAIGKRLLADEDDEKKVNKVAKVHLVSSSNNIATTSINAGANNTCSAAVNTKLELILGDRSHRS